MKNVIHNVTDRHAKWVGPWEVAALDTSLLGADDFGRTIIYRDSAGRAEVGKLAAWNRKTVWARFHEGETSAACSVNDVFLGVRSIGLDELMRARA